MGCIYIVKNTINGKCYIGQTTRSVEKRVRSHFKKNSGCPLLGKAIKKYGRDAFTVKILHDDVLDIFLDDLEIASIKKYNTLAPYGYNLESGGNKNKVLSDETRRKISESAKGRTLSVEHKQKLSETNKGNKHFLGKKHSEESKRKISESSTGRRHTESTKRKMSEAHKGKKHTKAHRIKLSESRRDFTHTDSTKRKMSEARKGNKNRLGIKHTEGIKKHLSLSTAHPERATAFDILKKFCENIDTSAPSLAEQRAFLRQKFPHISAPVIYKWVKAYHRFTDH